MPIPAFQTLILPTLRFASDGKNHAVGELREAMVKSFHLTDERSDFYQAVCRWPKSKRTSSVCT